MAAMHRKKREATTMDMAASDSRLRPRINRSGRAKARKEHMNGGQGLSFVHAQPEGHEGGDDA